MNATISLSSKLPEVGTTIFTVMSRLAQEHDAINLSQGFPNFGCDDRLLELAAKHMRAGHNQYAPMAGLPLLRERISAMTETFYGAKYDPETEVTITSGATEALFCAITAIVREGDEVIVIEPAYDSYIPAIKLCGGEPVCISLEYPDYSINWDNVTRLINQRTRAIIINSPHNPTGATLKSQDLQKLEKILANNSDMLVISDEVYEHIIFDSRRHESVARYPNLASRSFIISSFGKTFHVTGWKVGYCLAPAALMAEFRKVHQFVTFSTATPLQAAIADYLGDLAPVRELGAFYQEKRDYFQKLMAGSAFKPLNCAGTYFQLMSYADISNEPDTELAIRLTKDHKVASIPVSVFYRFPQQHNVLRFCFAKDNETLERAAEKLHKVRS